MLYVRFKVLLNMTDKSCLGRRPFCGFWDEKRGDLRCWQIQMVKILSHQCLPVVLGSLVRNKLVWESKEWMRSFVGSSRVSTVTLASGSQLPHLEDDTPGLYYRWGNVCKFADWTVRRNSLWLPSAKVGKRPSALLRGGCFVPEWGPSLFSSGFQPVDASPHVSWGVGLLYGETKAPRGSNFSSHLTESLLDPTAVWLLWTLFSTRPQLLGSVCVFALLSFSKSPAKLV